MLRRPNGRPDDSGDQIGDQNSTMTRITKIRLSIWSSRNIWSSVVSLLQFIFFNRRIIFRQIASHHSESILLENNIWKYYVKTVFLDAIIQRFACNCLLVKVDDDCCVQDCYTFGSSWEITNCTQISGHDRTVPVTVSS